MPAVELTRLRAQINELIARFGDPAGFHTALCNLLDQYSNRAYRAGKAMQPQPAMPTYRVPPLIIRQLELELSKTSQEQSEQALDVVEALWRDDHLEPRMLSTVLLGALPASCGEAVAGKLREWALPEENFRLVEALFHNGTAGLRRHNPQILLNLVEEWISSPRPQLQAIGVRALVPIVKDHNFENLPPVFRLLSLPVQTVPAALQTDLYLVMEALARRTPAETAYFLRQSLSMASSPSTARLIRRCLPIFGPAQQASLRAALQAANPS